jgi:hypothetical protein
MEDKSNLFGKIIMTIGMVTFLMFIAGMIMLIGEVCKTIVLWMIIPFFVWLGIFFISFFVVEIILNGIWKLNAPFFMDLEEYF